MSSPWVGGVSDTRTVCSGTGPAIGCGSRCSTGELPMFSGPPASDEQPEPAGGISGIAAVADAELREDRGDVMIGGLRRDEEPLGQLGVREPFPEEGEDLELPCRQARGVRPRRRAAA